MKYGWAIWNMHGCSQAAKCRLAFELNLDFVSFNTSPLKWAGKNPGEPAATPALLAELGLGWTLHAGLADVNDADAKARLTGSLGQTVAFAAEAGAPLCVSFDPVCSGEKPDKHYEAEATARGLELAFELLAPLKTGLALENSPLNCRPQDLAEVAGRFPQLGMLLDFGHLNMHLGADATRVAGYVAELPLPILDLHLHDNDGISDQHLALGDGTLPYVELFAALRARNYDGLVTLEVCPGLESLKADSQEDKEKLRRTLALAREHLGG